MTLETTVTPGLVTTGAAEQRPEPTWAGAPASPGPLRRVFAALEAGVTERAELTRVTGLGGEALDAALAHLVRSGRLLTTSLSSSCPPAGCGGCPSGRPGALAACGAGALRRAGAPLALSLARRRAE